MRGGMVACTHHPAVPCAQRVKRFPDSQPPAARNVCTGTTYVQRRIAQRRITIGNGVSQSTGSSRPVDRSVYSNHPPETAPGLLVHSLSPKMVANRLPSVATPASQVQSGLGGVMSPPPPPLPVQDTAWVTVDTGVHRLPSVSITVDTPVACRGQAVPYALSWGYRTVGTHPCPHPCVTTQWGEGHKSYIRRASLRGLNIDHEGTLTLNRWIRSPTRYPLRHAASGQTGSPWGGRAPVVAPQRTDCARNPDHGTPLCTHVL